MKIYAHSSERNKGILSSKEYEELDVKKSVSIGAKTVVIYMKSGKDTKASFFFEKGGA